MDAQSSGQCPFQGIRLRLGIMADAVEPLAQMLFQRFHVYMAVDVGTEIRHHRTFKMIGIVAVSLDHCLENTLQK